MPCRWPGPTNTSTATPAARSRSAYSRPESRNGSCSATIISDVPEKLGSRATYGLGGLGGHQGRKLEPGDVLPLGAAGSPTPGRELPEELRMPLPKQCEIRVVRGLYDYRVEPESLTRFFSEPWKVGSEADRVGYRLKGGTPLDFVPREPPFGAGDDPSNIPTRATRSGRCRFPPAPNRSFCTVMRCPVAAT